MRSVQARGRGGPHVLHVIDSATPSPTRGRVRVAVRTSGVAYGDVMRRRGVLVPPGAFVPGYDVCGVVDAVADEADAVWIGQRVACMLPTIGIGGYASHVCVPPDCLARVPDSLSDVQAVALVLNYITAYQILHHRLGVSDQTALLVHGGAGGVGTAALQYAQHLGATVWATASAGKHQVVRSLGATPIDYRNQRFEDVLVEAIPDGVDAVLDPIGGAHLRRSWSVTKKGGHVVSFGMSGDMDRGWGAVLLSARTMLGLKLDRSRTLLIYLVSAGGAVRDDLQTVLELGGRGVLNPIIGAEVPFERVREAHDLIDRAAVIGKVVLTHG